MPEFVFILGKNAELSKAEIESYLKARSIDFEAADGSEEFLVVRAERLPVEMAKELGGTLKTGEAVFSSGREEMAELADEIKRKVNFDPLFLSLPDKPLFAVSAYGDRNDAVFLAEFFKNALKNYVKGPSYVHLAERESAVSHTDIIKKKILQKGFEMLACRGGLFWLAKTTAVHDPFEFRKRDLERPAQRAIYSIPPRLARMMVNLSGITEGVLLDPFCGVGSILQEAALAGLQIRGVDIDAKAVEGCKKNLAWLEKECKISIGGLDEKISVWDARRLAERFSANSIDAVVTEPYLGEPLKEKPSESEARKILERLGPLFEESIREMAKVLKQKGRIVIVSPFFETEKGKMGLDMAVLARKNRLVLKAQFPDFEERHRTLRMINVLEKT
ncbi:MAG: methyltransferase domain-containing protein [Candidatus Aenigmatarchaeota archaeon]